MRKVRRFGALHAPGRGRALALGLALSVALAACGGQGAEAGGPKNPQDAVDTGATAPGTKGADLPQDKDTNVASPQGTSSPSETPPGPFACRLPEPVSSDDACTKDADCAPSVPCHAHACVAASRAVPRTPETVCTRNLDCHSADINRCSCYQGRCALVPP